MINYLKAGAEIPKEKMEIFRELQTYAKLIKDAVVLKDVEISVLGPVIEGKYTMASDRIEIRDEKCSS